MRRKAFVLFNETKLPTADRHDLAGFILGRPVDTWTDLTPDEWGRLLDALTGYHAVVHLRNERGL